METILQKLISGGYSQLLLAIATIGSFLLGLGPFGRWVNRYLHLPYFLVFILKLKPIGRVLPVTKLAEEISIGKQIDRRLYLLHGDYRKLTIVSFRKNSIGSFGQFDHSPNVNLLGFDKIFFKRLYGVGDRVQQVRVQKLLKIWRPYLTDQADSQILEVIQTSILCILGCDIPFEWKEHCFQVIRFHFLSSYMLSGDINLDELYLMLDAEKYLIKCGERFDDFKDVQLDIISCFRNDDRQNHNNEAISLLIRQETVAFYQFGDHIRRTK